MHLNPSFVREKQCPFAHLSLRCFWMQRALGTETACSRGALHGTAESVWLSAFFGRAFVG